jgi:hypothetical protein
MFSFGFSTLNGTSTNKKPFQVINLLKSLLFKTVIDENYKVSIAAAAKPIPEQFEPLPKMVNPMGPL